MQAGGHDPRACTLYCQVVTGVCSASPGNAAPPATCRPMRFLNKYDLQEPITGGPVKVYEALEPETGLQRLIQILEWKEVPAEVSTLQVLEQFRHAAPDPPGIILDAGRVEQTNQIYLVTSFPADPLSVQRWVTSYLAKSGQMVAQSTPKQEAPIQTALHPVAPTASPARESADSVQSWTRHEPGAFTKEFLGALDGSYKIASTPPPAPPKAETTKEPGAFTKEFLSLASSAAKEDKPDRVPDPVSRSGTSGWFKDIDPGSSTSAVGSPASELIVDKQTGEFTRFFRGHSDAPSEPPRSSFPPTADVLGTPRQDRRQDSPGEFTKMFKPDVAPPPEDYEKPNTAGFDRGSGELTRPVRPAPNPFSPQTIVSPQVPATPSFDSRPEATPSFAPAWKPQTMGTTPMPLSPGGPSPRPPVGSQPGNSFEPAWKEDKSGATQLITPAGTQQPPPEPVSRGPSEFTRIISATAVPGGGPPPPPPPNPSPAAVPPIQVPSVQLQQPHLPSMTAPPVPVHVPVVPSVPPIPNLPAMHAPVPPVAAPQAASQPAPKPVSYLTLIITLNVLLVVAVAIVLYFALKPHH